MIIITPPVTHSSASMSTEPQQIQESSILTIQTSRSGRTANMNQQREIPLIEGTVKSFNLMRETRLSILVQLN